MYIKRLIIFALLLPRKIATIKGFNLNFTPYIYQSRFVACYLHYPYLSPLCKDISAVLFG